jgi:hypothetical protein
MKILFPYENVLKVMKESQQKVKESEFKVFPNRK